MATSTDEPDVLDILASMKPDLAALDRAWSDSQRQAVIDHVLSLPPTQPAWKSKSRWISAGVAVAAVSTAALLLVPGAISPIPATPIHTPTSPSVAPSTAEPIAWEWTPTIPPPLSPRYGAITAWVNGTFLVFGGVSEAPCLGTNECKQTLLADGARYDPATDSWSAIPDAPDVVAVAVGAADPSPQTVVDGEVVYLLNPWSFMAYNATTNTWQNHPRPDSVSPATLVGVAGGKVIAFPFSQCVASITAGGESCDNLNTLRWYEFDPASEVWVTRGVVLDADNAAVLGDGAGATESGAVVIDDHLVVSAVPRRTSGSGASWVASVDLTSRTLDTLAEPAVPIQQPQPQIVGERVAWVDGQKAWFLKPSDGSWSSVDAPDDPGPFSGRTGSRKESTWYLTAGDSITVRGHLYHPATGQWTVVPALPVPNTDPVLAAGDRAVLTCWGYDTSTSSYGKACYLLRPAR